MRLVRSIFHMRLLVRGLALACTLLLPAQAVAQKDLEIRVEAGLVAGAKADGVESFKGIPFAAPPVGELRWRAPQPVSPWQGVRDATHTSDECMQVALPGIAAPIEAPLSEDCLHLNIWRPAGTGADAKLPVLVWIHGGGFVNGGISSEVLAGSRFARRGIIMVSINYRLGRFGFFAHPALSAAHEDGDLRGNYGMMDQIAALQWVQRNIAAFGGDPGKVTIFGESAGGRSVQLLLISPQARDLFRGAIIQSGGGRAAMAVHRSVSEDKPGVPSLETLGLAFAQSKGIEGTGSDALARLRALPAEAIVDGLSMFTMSRQAETYGGPLVDGVVISESPEQAFEEGHQARVPLMVGATSDDLGRLPVSDKTTLWQRFGDHADAARQRFDPDGKADPAKLGRRIGRELMMIEPARFVAAESAKQGVPTYAFRFSYVADSLKTKSPEGAPHATDVPFVMGTVDTKYGESATARDIAVGDLMNSYWANFARTLDPNGPGLRHWPRYEPGADVIMDFSEEGKALTGPDPLKSELDLVEHMEE